MVVGMVSSQTRLSTVEVDKKSYELFFQKKWDELIQLSIAAQSQGIDFFYLQARTGIAYYKLKKYRIAAEYLLKAWERDKSFEWLQEYLYYSLLWGGRPGKASEVAVDFSLGFQEKIGYDIPELTRLAVEGGYGLNPDFDNLAASNIGDELVLNENEYGQAFILKDYHFESCDLSHRVSPNLSVNHNLTLIGVNRQQQINRGDQKTYSSQTTQFQYYVNPQLSLGKRLNAASSANFILGDITYLYGIYLSDSTIYYSEITDSYTDCVLSGSIWFHWRNLSPGMEVNYANIYDTDFIQVSTWLTYYPLSNTNLYFTPRIYFKTTSTGDLAINTLGISGGLQLGKLHVYSQYLNGKMENFIEPAGFVVSNFPGKSNQKFIGSLYFPLGEQMYLVFRYINQDIVETYRTYTDDDTEINSINYDYIKQTLTVGLSWNF